MDSLRFATIAAVVSALGLPCREARAMGGCFPAPASTAVVSDHRVAFAIEPSQTILWDQVRFTGVSDFAWVLPIRPE